MRSLVHAGIGTLFVLAGGIIGFLLFSHFVAAILSLLDKWAKV